MHFLPILLLTSAAVLATPGPRYLVVPGRSIGTVAIGTDPLKSLAALGPPTHTEGALGESWNTWVGKETVAGNRPSQLDVYWARPAGAAPSSKARTVQLIRTTSPAFQLANGLHIGSPVADIAPLYPRHDKAFNLQLGTEEPRSLLDAPFDGIGFELSRPTRGHSAAIVAFIVHAPGVTLYNHDFGLKAYLEAQARR
ncbi:hypothetical protein [Hymenobacter convexus]|uniref:hypothetical protein n=1 Tax=Hymenobacter sp. CA1UV-4 TaxID=3063782 RepID=UPI0027126A0A|nr:hypothetical protein [Hymenobacter sp. CA1UV-4]MDO7853288.1 hypothetical protein [Hymenobacter sp. CA1UV-4]